MSIQVNDFRWEPGKNDAEYIKLLESSRDEWQKIAQKAIAKLKALSKAQEPRVIVSTELTDAELIEEIRKAPIVLKPNVDAAPVVHGRWMNIPDKPEWDQKMCSVCGDYFCCQGNYCPNCGAKMDGERRDDKCQG